MKSADYTFKNELTGDVVEVPPPDKEGRSVVKLNGEIIEQVTYSDEDGGYATTADGRKFVVEAWVFHILGLIWSGKRSA